MPSQLLDLVGYLESHQCQSIPSARSEKGPELHPQHVLQGEGTPGRRLMEAHEGSGDGSRLHSNIHPPLIKEAQHQTKV